MLCCVVLAVTTAPVVPAATTIDCKCSKPQLLVYKLLSVVTGNIVVQQRVNSDSCSHEELAKFDPCRLLNRVRVNRWK